MCRVDRSGCIDDRLVYDRNHVLGKCQDKASGNAIVIRCGRVCASHLHQDG